MIDLRRLEELQRAISAMEWNIENGQFSKRKAEYYRKLLKERDALLDSKSLYIGDEPEDGESNENDDDENHDFEERQIAGV